MEELQIVNLENTDIAHWDMAMLKAQLEQRLAYYKGMVYTDDSIKSAKDDRTTLNKAKKVIEIETVYKCPSCDTWLLVKDKDICPKYMDKHNYCPSCGQALDWSDT